MSQPAIVEAIAPKLSHNTKKAFKIAKKLCKCVQTKKGKILTTSKVLEDYKKKPARLLQSGKVRGKGSFSHWSGKVREFCEKSGKDFKKSGKLF